MKETLSIDDLAAAVAGQAVAVRARRRLQPAGGPSTKVFPPTYGVADVVPHKYCTEARVVDGQDVQTVTLDSVQSQANRIEAALRQAWDDAALRLPVVEIDFSSEEGLTDLDLTSLDVPHRLADALLRDSMTADGTPWRQTPEGLAFTEARVANATALYRLCPTALVFGMWDSTGPKGGLGAKFARALVSEIVGFHAVLGSKTSSRIDPAEIRKGSALIAHDPRDPADWVIDDTGKLKAFKRSQKEGKDTKSGTPAAINHGNVTPSIDVRAGGVTIAYAEQSVVLSLAALRRLRFRDDCAGQPLALATRAQAEQAARTLLAALALTSVVLQQDTDHDLRSRCLLVPEQPLTFELLGRDGEAPRTFVLTRAQALALLDEAHARADALGMGWANAPGEPVVRLKPMPKLADLIRRSRAAAAVTGEAEAED
jgi:CRISPR-associated protein Csb1